MTDTPKDIDLTMTEETTSGDLFWPLVGSAGFMGVWLIYAPRYTLLGLLAFALAGMALVNLYSYRRGPLRHRLKVSKTGIYESRVCKEAIPWSDIDGLKTGATLRLLCRDRTRFAKETWKDRLWAVMPWRESRTIDIKTLDYLGVDEERERLVPLILEYHPPFRGALINPTPPGMP